MKKPNWRKVQKSFPTYAEWLAWCDQRRESIISACIRSEVSIAQIAKDYYISPGRVYQIYKKYKIQFFRNQKRDEKFRREGRS